jgi:hypothetical protein
LNKTLSIVAVLSLAVAGCSQKNPAQKAADSTAAPAASATTKPLDTAALIDVGQPLTMQPVNLKGDWAENGWYAPIGAPPLDGPGYASYLPKGDAGVGSLNWAGTAPAGTTAIAIPILTGQVAAGVSFSVINDETGSVIATLNPPPAPIITWKLWRVSLPADVKVIRLLVVDSGSGFSEWAGVGTPHAITPGR